MEASRNRHLNAMYNSEAKVIPSRTSSKRQHFIHSKRLQKYRKILRKVTQNPRESITPDIFHEVTPSHTGIHGQSKHETFVV